MCKRRQPPLLTFGVVFQWWARSLMRAAGSWSLSTLRSVQVPGRECVAGDLAGVARQAGGPSSGARVRPVRELSRRASTVPLHEECCWALRRGFLDRPVRRASLPGTGLPTGREDVKGRWRWGVAEVSGGGEQQHAPTMHQDPPPPSTSPSGPPALDQSREGGSVTAAQPLDWGGERF